MDTEMIQGIKLVVDMLSGLGLYSLVVLVIGIIAYASVYISAFYFIPKFVVGAIKEWVKGKGAITVVNEIAKKRTVIDVKGHIITSDCTPQKFINLLEKMKRDSIYIHQHDVTRACIALDLYNLVTSELGKSEFDTTEAVELLKSIKCK